MIRLSDFLCGHVAALGFHINRNQQHHALFGQVEINNPSAAAFSPAGSSPAYFTRTTRARYHITRTIVQRNPVNERIALCLRSDFGCLLLKFKGFDHRAHELNYTGIPYFVKKMRCWKILTQQVDRPI